MQYIFFSILLFSALLTSGCASKQTLSIKTLEPAQVSTLADKKHIAVTRFQNDSIGLAGKIEASLADLKVGGKKYFTVINRQQINKILAEQKLQSSAMFDPTTAARIGKLIGVAAIITGEVSFATGTMRTYRKERKECLRYYKDGSGCAYWHFYNEPCHVTTATVAANMSIIDVQTAEVLYGDFYNKSYNADSCQNYDEKLLSKAQAINKLAEDIAREFALKLVPHYVYHRVTLLEELDVPNSTLTQEKEFENALRYIKAGRVKKAQRVLQKLLDEFNGDSAVVAYDLGVLKEALGKLEEAKRLYILADEKSGEPVDEINRAIVRIEEEIQKRDEASTQLKR